MEADNSLKSVFRCFRQKDFWKPPSNSTCILPWCKEWSRLSGKKRTPILWDVNWPLKPRLAGSLIPTKFSQWLLSMRKISPGQGILQEQTFCAPSHVDQESCGQLPRSPEQLTFLTRLCASNIRVAGPCYFFSPVIPLSFTPWHKMGEKRERSSNPRI